jgi:hypothetical protein
MRVFACYVVSKLQRHRCPTFGALRPRTLRTNGQLHFYIYRCRRNFVAPSLTRGRVCKLLYNCFWAMPELSLLGRSPAKLTALFYCLIWDSTNLKGQVPVFRSHVSAVRNFQYYHWKRCTGSMQCNVQFGYHLSICSGTKENNGKPWDWLSVVNQLTRPPLWSSGQSSWLHNGDVLCFLWGTNWTYICYVEESRPPLWSSGQSSWLQNWDVLRFLWGTNWIYIYIYMLCIRK